MKTTKITIKNLKANREEIIEKLTEYFGEENLRVAMEIMKDHAEAAEIFNTNETIGQVLEEMTYTVDFNRKNEKMHTADYIAYFNEKEEEKGNKWNPVTREWEKNN